MNECCNAFNNSDRGWTETEIFRDYHMAFCSRVINPRPHYQLESFYNGRGLIKRATNKMACYNLFIS